MRRYALRDDQWGRIKDFLPGREGHVGGTAADNRLFIEAILYKFTKGQWTAGKDAVDMNDRELIALVDQSMVGWVKWESKRPVDYQIGFIRDRFKPPRRGTLDDTDPKQWINGDPWQLTFFLPMADADGQLYVWSTTSHGGRDALANLQEAFADHCEATGGTQLPRVALSSGSYGHADYGRVDTPAFDILGWVDPPTIVRQLRVPAASAASPAITIDQAAGVVEHKPDPDDEIPF